MIQVDSNNIEKIYRKKYLDNLPEVTNSDPQYQFLSLALSMLNIEKPVVLDAGCGGGKYAQALAASGMDKIHAVDLFNEVPLLSGVDYRKASIDKLPFPDNMFHLVYSFSVLFYLDDPEEGIAEFARVLKPGGLVVMSAHTRYSLFTASRIVKRLFGMTTMDHLKGVKFYSASAYAEMFRRCGFEVLLIDGYRISFFFGPIYRKLSRLIEKLTGWQLPMSTSAVSDSRLLAWYRSVFGYHSVVLARKL